MEKTQSYANHTRWFPLVHFVVVPLLLLNLIEHVVRIFTAANSDVRLEQIFWTILSITLILMILAARFMAMRVQDRVIRLEERLRYRELLSPSMAAAASTLPIGKIIAMRFASDEELPSIAERVLNAELNTNKEIKMAVKTWRPDHLRV
jgi:Family of unknown function (DUF6526)